MQQLKCNVILVIYSIVSVFSKHGLMKIHMTMVMFARHIKQLSRVATRFRQLSQ